VGGIYYAGCLMFTAMLTVHPPGWWSYHIPLPPPLHAMGLGWGKEPGRVCGDGIVGGVARVAYLLGGGNSSGLSREPGFVCTGVGGKWAGSSTITIHITHQRMGLEKEPKYVDTDQIPFPRRPTSNASSLRSEVDGCPAAQLVGTRNSKVPAQRQTE